MASIGYDMCNVELSNVVRPKDRTITNVTNKLRKQPHTAWFRTSIKHVIQ